jgi:hypothetical protein
MQPERHPAHLSESRPASSEAPVCRPSGRLSKRSAGYLTSAEQFADFAAAASHRLRRMAFLLCGDWHAADDRVQTTLAKLFVSWRKIRRQDGGAGAVTPRPVLGLRPG